MQHVSTDLYAYKSVMCQTSLVM